MAKEDEAVSCLGRLKGLFSVAFAVTFRAVTFVGWHLLNHLPGEAGIRHVDQRKCWKSHSYPRFNIENRCWKGDTFKKKPSFLGIYLNFIEFSHLHKICLAVNARLLSGLIIQQH